MWNAGRSWSVLKALPDEELLTALEQRRGRGRDDYPIRAMWRALVAGMESRYSRCCGNWGATRRFWRCAGLIRWVSRPGGGGSRGSEGGLEGGAATRRGAVGLEFLPIFEFTGEAGGGTGTDSHDGEAAGTDGGGGGLRGASGVRREGGREPFDGEEERKRGKTSGADWGKHEWEGRTARRGSLEEARPGSATRCT